MAAGLPSVISDWDGYRDTVRHGVDGFRIPTSIAPPGCGEIFMRRYFCNVDTYDMYIGQISHFTAVDISQTVKAYHRLIEHVDLRRQMGSPREDERERFSTGESLFAVIKNYGPNSPNVAGPLLDNPIPSIRPHTRSVWIHSHYSQITPQHHFRRQQFSPFHLIPTSNCCNNIIRLPSFLSESSGPARIAGRTSPNT